MKRSFSLVVFALVATILFAQEAGAKWELIWADEFNASGLPDPTKWSFETDGNAWGWGNGEDQFYTDSRLENIQQTGGNLVITALKENKEGKKYTSARISSKGKAEWRYGRFEARMKLPSGKGIWPAFWMMPAKDTYGNWPSSGEIDIMEFFGFLPNKTHATIHTARYNHKIGTHKKSEYRSKVLHSEFHVYAVEWFPDRLDFYFDDIKIFTFTKEQDGSAVWPFDRPFYLILNNAVGGDWCRQNGGIGKTPFPQEFLIDYVRVYKHKVAKEKVTITTPERSGGKITFTRGGNACLSGETIAIKAIPNSGFRFVGWSGDVAGTKPVKELRVFEDMTISANFIPITEILDYGNFWEGLTGWNNWVDTSKATVYFHQADGNITIQIDKAPPSDWQVQMTHPVKLEKGKRYRLSFKARSRSDTMPVRTGFNQNHEPWVGYTYETFMVTKDWKTYTIEMEMTEPTDPNSRIEFDLGAKKGSIILGNVSLVEVKGE